MDVVGGPAASAGLGDDEGGDLQVALRAQTEPYEVRKGDAERLQEKWLDTICGWIHENKGWTHPGPARSSPP